MYDCKAPLSRFYYPDTRRIINAFIIIINQPTLFERRTKLCQSYFRKIHNADHKLNKLLPNQRNISYDLRTYNTLPVPLARTDRLRRSLIPWGLANWQHNVL